ncbi:gaf sensor signal transduction histidine kinase [Leptolyngbya sp. Heron Island J]|uniref:GAF domain-containing protein n=1 Tax=Leptolyngbya sp. Heron Island J TaxID=1385935 RepID=UPI0003B9660D|nr:GAF domain-containing protein [Leptolyngbya sp. Heron Island J]ESA31952.1 gaf sensor signal transduction histidine kinase [Leptolyngbya sp. Heron Island J]
MASDPQIQTELQQALQSAISQEREQSAKRQVAWLSTIAEVANLLLKTPDYTSVLPAVVRLLGEVVGSDRCLIIQELIDPETEKPWLDVLAEWAQESIPEVSADIPEGGPIVDGEWLDLHEQLQRGELTNYIVAEMPEPWRGFLEAQGIVSSTSVPIMVEGQFWGHIDFDNCSEARLYDATEIGVLQTAAEMIAGAISRSAEDKALRKSEQRYRTLFEISSEGIYRFEFDEPISLDLSVDEQVELVYRYWHLAEANDAFLAMYNLGDADNLPELRLTELHVSESAKNQAMLRTFVENGHQIQNAETEEADREGNPRYFLNSVISVITDGFITGGWGSQLDITERRLAQQALLEAEQARSLDLAHFNTELQQTLDQLAESEERYRTLFEISNEGIYRFEFDEPIPLDLPVDEQIELVYRYCRMVGANAAFANTYGLDSPEDFIDVRLTEVHVMGSLQNQAMMRTYVENDYQLRNTETEELDLQGNPRYFLNNIATLIKDGCAIGGWASQLDITERRLAQQALLEAEQNRVAELAKTNQALKNSLDRLSADPNFNAFLGYVLLEITQQLSLDIAVLRFYNAETQTLPLELLVEQGQIKQKEQIQAPPAYLCPTAASLPVWETLLRTKRPFIMRQENASAGVHTDQISDLQVTVNLLLKLGDEPIGILCLGATQPKALTPEEIELAQALTQQATLAIQLMRLADEAKHAAIFEERNRLAGEIHDTLAQAFTGISLQLGVAKSITQQDPTETQRILDRALQLAHAGLAEARRAVWAIYPSAAKYTNLDQMLRDVTAQRVTNIPIQLQIEGNLYSVPALLGLNLTRIAQEAITNALKHSQASTIRVRLTYGLQDISLHINDDGCGFLPQQDSGGFGLMSLSQRSERIGGELQIQSQPGQGTEIWVHVNLEHFAEMLQGSTLQESLSQDLGNE